MKRMYIVMYHYVRELNSSRYPGIKGLDYALFKEQIKFFHENFHVVTMEQVMGYYEAGESLPENAVLLTFDDGYIDHFTYVFPILSAYQMQGSFFIPGKVFMEHTLLDVNKIHFLLAKVPIGILCDDLKEQLNRYRKEGWEIPFTDELYEKYAVANRFDNKDIIFFKRILQTVLPEELRNQVSSSLFKKYMDVSEETLARELYINYDQMLAMKKYGMFFGIHGYDHYWMNQLSRQEFQEDITKALACMDAVIDQKHWIINYPYGSYSNEVIENLKGTGCALGLSTDVRAVDLEIDDPFKLPRLDTNDFPPIRKKYRS